MFIFFSCKICKSLDLEKFIFLSIFINIDYYLLRKFNVKIYIEFLNWGGVWGY